MRLGYNTNGLAHHDLLDAIDLLAAIGYRSVAITLDHHSLNPYSADCQRQLIEVRKRLARYGLSSVVETGARYLLNPKVKHEPTLVTRDAGLRRRRIDFLRRSIDVAAELASDCVSLWSGVVRDDAGEEPVWERLVNGLGEVLEHAGRRGMRIGFEPEPGMFIDTMARYQALRQRLPSPSLKLTLDIGHLHCQHETPIAERICEFGGDLVNVHLEDMRSGVHEHLMFGEGEIDFGPVFSAFEQIGYGGGVHVELSRHSHDGPVAARRAWDFLRPYWESSR